MQIRCEKCATLYNLDESLIPPQGAPVQCTRCGHVFTAHRPEPVPPPPRTQSYGNMSPKSGTLVFNASDVEAAMRERQQAQPGSAQIPAGGTQAAFPAQPFPQQPAPAPAPRSATVAFQSPMAQPPHAAPVSPPRSTNPMMPAQGAPQPDLDPGGSTMAFGSSQVMPPAFGNMATYPSMPAQQPERPQAPDQRTGTNTQFGSMAGVNPAFTPAQHPQHPQGAAPRGGTSAAFPQQGAGPAYPHAPAPPQGAYPAPTSPSMPSAPYGAVPDTNPSMPAPQGWAPPGWQQQPAPPQGWSQPGWPQPGPPQHPSAPQGWAAAPQPPQGYPQPGHHAPAPGQPSQVAPYGAPQSPSQLSGFGAPPARARTSPTGMSRPQVRTAARSTSTGEFEAQMVARARRRVIVLVGLAVIAALVVLGVMVGPALLEGRHDPAAVVKVQSALEAIVKGDPESAQKGSALAAEAVALDPRYRGARATQGMGLYLAAAEVKDRIERLEKQRPGLDKALKKAEDAGDTAEQDRVRAQIAELTKQHTELVNEATRLKGEAEPLINDAYKGAESDPDAIRALGFLRALEGDEANVEKLVKAYRLEVEAQDGWAELLAGIAGSSGKGSPEKRTAAIAALEKALSQAPGMTLAYLGIGRSRLDLEDHAGARAALNEALKVTPENPWLKRVLADVQLAETEIAEKARRKAEAEAAAAAESAAAQPPASDAKPANSEPESRGPRPPSRR